MVQIQPLKLCLTQVQGPSPRLSVKAAFAVVKITEVEAGLGLVASEQAGEEGLPGGRSRSQGDIFTRDVVVTVSASSWHSWGSRARRCTQ